ncbi:MAG: efflux RND transporter periplasmic adaptor subunit [Mariprofundales bacterium]|nr:efflux RND transporter periplasmic adaptor subunit [Mariprofundales bacterium]
MSKSSIVVAVVALVVGVGGGYLFSSQSPEVDSGESTKQVAERGGGPCPGGAQPLAWRSPMNPTVTSPTPKKDGMGMDYVPICADAADSGSAPAGTVRIDPTITQDIGVRVTTAKRERLSRTITTVGRVTYDETKLVTLHPKVEGWADKLFVDKTGEQVERGTMLLSYYSPQLVSSQEEYLLALSNWQQLKSSPYPDIRAGAKRLLHSALDRLRFFDVPNHQIVALRKTHRVLKNLHIQSPSAGVITKIGVREGAHITPMLELYQIADLSRVWVLADLYEYEVSWVHKGDIATLTIASLPGRSFTGKITYIYPYLDAKTRTNKVRIEFDNSAGLLKPDMFGDVTLSTGDSKPVIFVPRESLLITGKRNHLFVQTAPGRYEPRTVKTGVSSGGMIEIIEGVEAGEKVVTSGQFLIDSESSIREATAKMVAPKSESQSAAPSMDGMEMDGMEMGDTQRDKQP